ncbi:MAG: signal recognition particle subunit SRP19/SEC65 family protein [Candidatus Helarchaeota archaeon]
MKNKGYYVIWPHYFDVDLTRKEGRRVNKKTLAVKNPTLRDLEEAARLLGYEYKINPTALYPRFWYLGKAGYLSIKIEGSKTEVIKKIASRLKKLKKKQK